MELLWAAMVMPVDTMMGLPWAAIGRPRGGLAFMAMIWDCLGKPWKGMGCHASWHSHATAMASSKAVSTMKTL